jgi:hypothetical protein
MKRFIRSNVKLSIGALVAIFIILVCLITFNSPEWWVGAGQILDLLYQLSIGYCLSILFYVLQVYLPGIKRQEKAFGVIKTDIDALSSELLDVVFVVDECATIDEDSLSFNKELFYFKRVDKIQEKQHGWASRFELSKSHFEEIKKSIDKRLEHIVNNSLYSQNDFSIIKTISELQSNHLFSTIIVDYEANEQSVRATTKNVGADFCEFKRIAYKLWRMNHDSEQVPCELSENEIEFYNERMQTAPKISGTSGIYIKI